MCRPSTWGWKIERPKLVTSTVLLRRSVLYFLETELTSPLRTNSVTVTASRVRNKVRFSARVRPFQAVDSPSLYSRGRPKSRTA